LGDLLDPPRPVVITELAAPGEFFAGTALSPRAISMNWREVEGASSYRVERAVIVPEVDGTGALQYALPADEDFETLAPFVYAASYTDSILNAPAASAPEYRNRYYYRVRAQNPGAGLEPGAASEWGLGTLFAPAKNVQASLGTSRTEIRVDWEAAPGALSYEIWRSEYETGASPFLLDSRPGNQCFYINRLADSEKGKEFYYSVTAVSRSGAESVRSPLALGYTLVEGAPEKPANVALAAGAGRGGTTITLTWDADSNAGAWYAVYRSSSADSALSLLTKKNDSTFTATTLTDSKNPQAGLYYYYQVQALVESETGEVLKGPLSDPIEAFLLSAPAGVTAEKAAGGAVRVSWYPALGSETEQAAYTYAVFGDDSVSGAFSAPACADVPGTAAADGVISVEVDAGNAFAFYRVVTKNGSVVSAPSAICGPAPASAVLSGVSRAVRLDGQEPNSSGVYPVAVYWTKPASETPAAYHVYRSSSAGTGYRRVTDTPVQAAEGVDGAFTWIDVNTTAKAGKRFFYKVLSLNTLGQGAFYSDEGWGYGALSHEQYMLEYNKTLKSSQKKLTLMHKPVDTDKLGSESKSGAISGTVSYNAALDGLGARIVITYSNYADFYIDDDPALGPSFTVSGNTNTSANMSASGTMDGTMTAAGMYPGKIYYDAIQIKGGAAAGGTYGIEPEGFPRREISWTYGQ
jgi:hypothetical protein